MIGVCGFTDRFGVLNLLVSPCDLTGQCRLLYYARVTVQVAERSSADRSIALAYMMKECHAFQREDIDIDETLELYRSSQKLQHCSHKLYHAPVNCSIVPTTCTVAPTEPLPHTMPTVSTFVALPKDCMGLCTVVCTTSDTASTYP